MAQRKESTAPVATTELQLDAVELFDLVMDEVPEAEAPTETEAPTSTAVDALRDFLGQYDCKVVDWKRRYRVPGSLCEVLITINKNESTGVRFANYVAYNGREQVGRPRSSAIDTPTDCASFQAWLEEALYAPNQKALGKAWASPVSYVAQGNNVDFVDVEF